MFIIYLFSILKMNWLNIQNKNTLEYMQNLMRMVSSSESIQRLNHLSFYTVNLTNKYVACLQLFFISNNHD